MKAAFQTARELYDELIGNRSVTTVATRVATDREIQDKLRDAVDELRTAANRVQGKKDHSGRNATLLIAGIALGVLFNPVTGPATRKWLADAVFGGDDFTYDEPGRQRLGRRRLNRGLDLPLSRSPTGSRSSASASPPVPRAASARRSEPGSSPLALEMSEIWSRIAPGSGARLAVSRTRPGSHAPVRAEADVLQPLPRVEVRRRVDRAVVAEPEQRHRVDLEVQVVRRALGVAGVADEAEHVAGPDLRAVQRVRRIGGEVRVVELVALAVAQPEAPAADSFQPTEKTVPSATARTGAPSGAKMSSPWCQLDVGAGGAERVAVRRRRRRPGRRNGPRSDCGWTSGTLPIGALAAGLRLVRAGALPDLLSQPSSLLFPSWSARSSSVGVVSTASASTFAAT